MNLFVYGTLMNLDLASTVVGRKITESTSAKLEGFRKDTWGPYFIIVPDLDSNVEGIIIPDIDDDDLTFLDDYEGIPDTPYVRIMATAQTDDGAYVSCWVYADA